MVIAGVSLVLFTAREGSVLQAARKMFVRGGYILCVAAVITVVSWLIFPSEVVVFGILHLIGCATILAIPFVVLRVRGWITFGFGSVIIAISPLLAYVRGPAFLIPFEVTPTGFATLDYEPLIPWFGVLLVGVALGSVLYAGGVRCRVGLCIGYAWLPVCRLFCPREAGVTSVSQRLWLVMSVRTYLGRVHRGGMRPTGAVIPVLFRGRVSAGFCGSAVL